MIEIEKTYLAKRLPKGLKDCEYHEIHDVFFPADSKHPGIRLRNKNGTLELTKKRPDPNAGSKSIQIEETINLEQNEYEAFKQLLGKELRKRRYFYPYRDLTAEVDVYLDKLEGLVVIEFEFNSKEELKAFEKPEFCLVDVSEEEFVATGYLCGKGYGDIEGSLKRLGYWKLSFSGFN